MVISGIALVSHSHSQNAPHRKKAADREAKESDNWPSYQELDKLYNNLVRRHEKVGKAFQMLQEQNEALAKELKEKENENKAINCDAEELVDLVQKKNGVVADLEKSLQEAKATIVELKELQHLWQQQMTQNADDEPTREQNRVSSNSLATIYQWYEEVLAVLRENSCSMANMFRLSGCPSSMLHDFMVVAELKIIDGREHDRVLSVWWSSSVRELEVVCRRWLKCYLPVVADMRREGKL